jgi:hypothetical protein
MESTNTNASSIFETQTENEVRPETSCKPNVQAMTEYVVEKLLIRASSFSDIDNVPRVIAHACEIVESWPRSASVQGSDKKLVALTAVRTILLSKGVSEAQLDAIWSVASSCVDAMVSVAKKEFHIQSVPTCFQRIFSAIFSATWSCV